MLGVERTDLVSPTGSSIRSPAAGADPDRYAFRIHHRSEDADRQHQAGLGDLPPPAPHRAGRRLVPDRRRALRRRWPTSCAPGGSENPFLSGVHWTSGIELGVRLIAWTWIRRLLDEWPGVADLFEHNELAVRQIRWHQEYLAAFRSRGSSANNHVIAEAAGQLVAAARSRGFPRASGWRRTSAALLERELVRNTFPSGLNRELASDYHVLRRRARVPGGASRPRPAGAPAEPGASGNACAAMIDARPPSSTSACDRRARATATTAARSCSTLRRANRWPVLLALGEALFGRLDWWPPATAGVESSTCRRPGGPRT